MRLIHSDFKIKLLNVEKSAKFIYMLALIPSYSDRQEQQGFDSYLKIIKKGTNHATKTTRAGTTSILPAG